MAVSAWLVKKMLEARTKIQRLPTDSKYEERAYNDPDTLPKSSRNLRFVHLSWMKVKKKVITDQCGSASQSRAIVREVLWGLVGKIDEGCAENESVYEPLPTTTILPSVVLPDESELPMQFGSKTSRKRKGGRDNGKSSNKKQYTGLSSTLPVPKYNGTLLEENVYLVKGRNIHGGQIVRVSGVGAAQPPGSSVTGRVLGKIGSTEQEMDFAVVEFARSELHIVPAEDRHEAHKLVQIDEQRILMHGMPAGVHLKYWDQRYRLLSLFDRGVRLDPESWYSITPEAVAKHVTSSCIGRARELHCGMDKVLDCFSGCGGNTIPFAAMGRTVVSVDLDPVKLGHLKHNCGVYGVDLSHVDTVCAEVYHLLSSLIPEDELRRIRARYDQILKDTTEPVEESNEDVEKEEVEEGSAESSSEGVSGLLEKSASVTEAQKTEATGPVAAPAQEPIAGEQLSLCRSPDLIILSPPWGGPDYLNAKKYDLYTMLTSGCGLYMAMLAAASSPNLLFLLPVNTCEEQVKYIADVVQMPYVIEYVVINNSPKVMAIYMGSIVAKKQVISVSKLATNVGTHNNHVHFDSVLNVEEES